MTQKDPPRFCADLVWLDAEARSWDEALGGLARLAISSGHARSTLRDAVIERERSAPTGLPTDVPVAIPHADPHHVVRSGIAVGLFRAPVAFKEMGNEKAVVHAHAAFLLLVAASQGQVAALSSLVDMLRDGEWAVEIQGLRDPAAIAETFNRLLKGR